MYDNKLGCMPDNNQNCCLLANKVHVYTVVWASKTEVQIDARNSKSGNMTSPGEYGPNIRTNASPK